MIESGVIDFRSKTRQWFKTRETFPVRVQGFFGEKTRKNGGKHLN